ncbi:MAG: SUMF1/EgtB/PvdO family nonheme iron enzyme, partial [Candidatus Kapaibacterium sp.]
ILSHEVTNREFARFIESSQYQTDAERLHHGQVAFVGMQDWEWNIDETAYWRFPHGAEGPCVDSLPDYPVTQITYNDAVAFCEWAGVRLPTLEEWEVAARAGATDLYPWGSEFILDGEHRANIWQGSGHETNSMEDGFLYVAPIKSFPPNAWGLYDVIGNVFEYCQGQVVPDGAERNFACARGGSWWCSFSTCGFFNLVDIGSANRLASLSNQGFRVVKE